MLGPHGHVVPRPDGMLARCGGPALCPACAQELAAQQPPGGIVGVLRAEASAVVVQGPETLARIAAGELNPDGTPVRDDDDEAMS
jgi:hypothetical protein